MAIFHEMSFDVGMKISREDALIAAKVIEMYLLKEPDYKVVFERAKEIPIVSIVERKKEVTTDGYGGLITKYLE